MTEEERNLLIEIGWSLVFVLSLIKEEDQLEELRQAIYKVKRP